MELEKVHDIENTECPSCWTGFPRPCKCGGLIHAEFGDEMSDGYYLNYICSKCGEDYQER